MQRAVKLGVQPVLCPDFLHGMGQQINIEVLKANGHRPQRRLSFFDRPIGQDAHIRFVVIPVQLEISDLRAEELILSVLSDFLKDIGFLIPIAQVQPAVLQQE